MSSSRKYSLLICAGLVVAAGTIVRAAEPGYYGYGEKATPEQIAGWDIDARGDDGAGLPPSRGTVQKGGFRPTSRSPGDREYSGWPALRRSPPAR